MDNLVFEKIWIDSNPVEDLFQIRVTANNDKVTMSSEVFAQTVDVNDFQSGTHDILNKPFSIVIGNDDNSNIDCVKFCFTSGKTGRVSILIFMKTCNYENPDGRSNDTAQFTIVTDIASLDRFSLELHRIANGEIGERVQLHY